MVDLRRGNEEIIKSQMGGRKNSVFQYTGTRIYHHRRCKSRKMMVTNIDSLPDEVLFNILLQLPVQDIYKVMRLVCWKWYYMIRTRHFVYEHLKQSSNGSLGILLHAGSHVSSTYQSVRARGLEPLTYVSMRRQQQGRDPISIEINRVTSCKLKSYIWTSCNGLLLLADVPRLFRDRFDGVVYYIENPTTNQRFFLPKFSCPRTTCVNSSGLAYVASSMEYKVAVTYGCRGKENCVIFTVGVDCSWRPINTDHLSTRARIVLGSCPLTTEGFLHWFNFYYNGIVVTLNIETETLKEFHVPQGYEKTLRRYLPTGTSYLSFVVKGSSKSQLSWEAWEMDSETGEWTRLPNIDFEDQKHVLTEHVCSALRLVPIGWLKYKEVMLFNIRPDLSNHYFTYDAHTQKIYPFELEFCRGYPIDHVNSLVCLDG